jgi:hypothetical protein
MMMAGLMLLASSGEAFAQGRGGGFGRGGGRGGGENSEKMREMRTKMEALRVCPVEVMWTVLSFDIVLTDEQHPRLMKTFRSAWDRRRDVFAFSEEHEAWGEGKKRLRDLKKQTDAMIKSVLTKDQWKAYEKAVKKIEKSTRPESPGGRF